MDHAQRPVAVLDRIHYDAYCKQIINLVDRLILILHFFINAEKMLDAAVNLSFNTRIFDMFAYFIDNILDISFPFALTDGNLIHQIVINFRFQIF